MAKPVREQIWNGDLCRGSDREAMRKAALDAAKAELKKKALEWLQDYRDLKVGAKHISSHRKATEPNVHTFEPIVTGIPLVKQSMQSTAVSRLEAARASIDAGRGVF